MDGSDFVSAIRGAAPYVHRHTGRTFVIALPGETFVRSDVAQILGDIALLSSLGIKLVLVHGARPQIDAALAERGLPVVYHDDLRITDAAAMAAVKSAVGALRMDIESMLSASLANTAMRGAQLTVVGGSWITAQPVGVKQGVDHHLTGSVRRIDIEGVSNALGPQQVALLSPIGFSPTGETFNLRNAEVAEAVAVGLRADKLIFMLESDPGSWNITEGLSDAGQLLLSQAATALDQPEILEHLGTEDRNCIRAGLAAGRAGVKRVHLVGSGRDGSLLRELFTRDGAGVMFTHDADYEATRRARVEDVTGIHTLIRPQEEAGILVPRSLEQLELEIDSFSVMVRDGTVIACNALVPYPGEDLAEFACVAVHPAYRGAHRARALLQRAELNARRAGIKRLFALTTRTTHWFVENGFQAGGPGDLPAARRDAYDARRNSHVLIKDL